MYTYVCWNTFEVSVLEFSLVFYFHCLFFFNDDLESWYNPFIFTICTLVVLSYILMFINSFDYYHAISNIETFWFYWASYDMVSIYSKTNTHDLTFSLLFAISMYLSSYLSTPKDYHLDGHITINDPAEYHVDWIFER